MSKSRPLTEIERKAIDEAYRCYINTLQYNAKKYLKTTYQLEECIQRTFEIAIINIDKFMASENRAGWLVLTCRHTAMDMIREAKKHMTVQLESITQSSEMLTYTLEDVDVPEGRENVIHLIEQHLSKKNREFFRIVTTYRGKSDKELSELLGISESAVRGRWKRLNDAIKKLPDNVKNNFEFL